MISTNFVYNAWKLFLKTVFNYSLQHVQYFLFWVLLFRRLWDNYVVHACVTKQVCKKQTHFASGRSSPDHHQQKPEVGCISWHFLKQHQYRSLSTCSKEFTCLISNRDFSFIDLPNQILRGWLKGLKFTVMIGFKVILGFQK